MDDSPNTPLALALIGGAALCFFMAARPWPQSGGKAVRPEAYAQSVISGNTMAPGPAATDDTQSIETGLGAILTIWALSKIAGLFTGFPTLFGNGESGGREQGAPAEENPAEEPTEEGPPVVENPGGAPPGGGGIEGELGELAEDL